MTGALVRVTVWTVKAVVCVALIPYVFLAAAIVLVVIGVRRMREARSSR